MGKRACELEAKMVSANPTDHAKAAPVRYHAALSHYCNLLISCAHRIC